MLRSNPAARLAMCLVVALGALALAGGASAAVVTAPVTNGPCLAPSGSYCAIFRPYVSGTFRVTNFAVQDGGVVAVGVVEDGSFFQFFPSLFGATFPNGTALTLPVTEIDASCSSSVVTLTLKGSEPPDPANGIYEPLPPVLFFDVTYEPPGSPAVTAPVAVGLLPATSTIDATRGAACSLAHIPSRAAGALAARLNALL